MNDIAIGIEGRIFCLFVVIFIYFFHKNNFEQTENYYYIHNFLVAGILCSIANEGLFMVACVCFYVMTVFLWCDYEYGIKPGINALICIMVAGLSFLTLIYNSNTVTYILVFGQIINLVIKQHNMIRTDNLTKLYNRYGMDAEIREQLRQYKSEADDLFYIIACDIDDFKQINDTWGHPEGDRALILVANALSEAVEKFGSNVFRIGGDEFVIITDTSDEKIVFDITEEIRKTLDKIDFRDDFDIKMSIGTALYDGKHSISELIVSADKKLYEAKKREKSMQ